MASTPVPPPNNTQFWSPQGGYLNPQNFIQGGNVTYLNADGSPGQAPLNPNQFATDPTAKGIAGNLGGTVRNDQLSGPGLGYVGASGAPITQAQIQTPGNPNAMNAGLVANNFGQYGDTPGSRGMYNISGNGAAPPDQSYAQYAMSQPGFKMDPLLANSGPGYNFAYDPRTGTYTNTAPGAGQTGITQAQATQQMQRANGVTAPGSTGNTATGSVGLSAGTVPTGGNQATPGITAPRPGTPSWVPPGFRLGPGGNLIPTNIANGGNTATPGAGQSPNNYGIGDTLMPNSSSVGDSRAPLPPPPPPQTSGISGPTNRGFSPTGNASDVAPNAQYLSSAGNGNPLSYLRYNDPQANPFADQYGLRPKLDANGQPVLNPDGSPVYANPAAVVPYTGGDISKMAINNRNLALGEGAGLSSQLQNYTNFQAGQSADFQQQLASAFAPIAAGRGGYTNEQMASILDEPALQALQQTPGQAQANFLTPGETAAIQGDPWKAYQQLGADESGLDFQQNMNADAINQGLSNQQNAVNANIGSTAQNVRTSYGNQGYNVNNALTAEANAVNPYVDPTALNISDQYSRDYQFGPQDEQAIREQAGRTVGNQELADEDRLLQQANAQGNTSPLAIQAARDRMRRTGAINEANAMSDASIKAKQLALQTTQQREATRLGAAQNYAGLGTSTQETLGAQNVAAQQNLGTAALGAEQYLGSQNQAAQLALGQSNLSNQQQLGTQGQQNAAYKATTNLGAGQQAETAASNRSAGLATNRQTTEQANQGTQLQRGQYIYGQNNATNTGFANQTLQQQQEYRNYLQNQQTQANQNQTIGNQQQLGVYGQQTGAANAATSGAISNYGTTSGDLTDPGGILRKALGVAKGGTFSGPHEALVGEAGPELILTFGHYGDKPIDKLEGGGGPYGPLPGLPSLQDYGYGEYGAQNDNTSGAPAYRPTPWSSGPAAAPQAAAQPSNQSVISQGPTGAGAIHPKPNTIWQGIASGLGGQLGTLSGTYGGNTGAGANSNVSTGAPLSGLLRAVQIAQGIKDLVNKKPGAGTTVPGSGPSADSAAGMAYGGTVAPVTAPPPQFPDVDATGSSSQGVQVENGTVATVGPPYTGGGSPAPTKTTPPLIGPGKKVPPTFPPSSQTHEYIPPEPEWPPITLTHETHPDPTPRPAEAPLPRPEQVQSVFKPGGEPPKGGGEGKPSPYPYPPIIPPGGLTGLGESDSTFKPQPIGLGKSIHAPVLRPGGLTGLGESDSTFNPEVGGGPPIQQGPGTVKTDTGPTGNLTPPIIPPGGLTGPGKSDTAITYPPPDPYPSIPPVGLTPPPGPQLNIGWNPVGSGVTPPQPTTGQDKEGTPSVTSTIDWGGYAGGWGDTPPSWWGWNGGSGNGTGGNPTPPPGTGGGGPGGGGMNEDELARGGVVSPTGAHHYYGSDKKLHSGAGVNPKMARIMGLKSQMAHIPGVAKVEMVDKPTVMELGSRLPQAVLPLRSRKSNKVTPAMIPGLAAKFGDYASSARM